MLFTNLTVTKIRRNEFWIEIREYQAKHGVLRTSFRQDFHVFSIQDTQTVLSTLPSRECQRTGTSSRVASRFRSTKIGDLCFTVRWDGGAGRNHVGETENDSFSTFVAWCPRGPSAGVELLQRVYTRCSSINAGSEG